MTLDSIWLPVEVGQDGGPWELEKKKEKKEKKTRKRSKNKKTKEMKGRKRRKTGNDVK